MKLLKLTALALTLTVLAGCSNFVSDFGVPTVQISPGGAVPQVAQSGNTQVLTGLSIKAEVQSLPGSPGGTIAALNLLGGGTLPGSAIRGCGSTTKPEDCPKVILEVTFLQPSIPLSGTIVVTGYQALPNNGQPARTVNLASPLTLY